MELQQIMPMNGSKNCYRIEEKSAIELHKNLQSHCTMRVTENLQSVCKKLNNLQAQAFLA